MPLAEILPLALAVAASPFPIVPVILLLFTERARACSLAFLAGWTVGVAGAATVFVLLADVVAVFDEPPSWVAWARMLLGIALIGWAVRLWWGRGEQAAEPGWMATLADAGPTTAVRYALLLSIANPKIVLLAAAAGIAIGSGGDSAAAEVAAVVLFALVGSVSVALPVLLFMVFGSRILGPLGTLRDWLRAHNAVIMAVVFLVIGVLLLWNGVQGI